MSPSVSHVAMKFTKGIFKAASYWPEFSVWCCPSFTLV